MYEKTIFRLDTLLYPHQFGNFLIATNPGGYVDNGKLVILPRLGITDDFCKTVIGICEPIDMNNLDTINHIHTKVIITAAPTYNGVEDARITEDGKRVLFVATNDRGPQTSLYDMVSGVSKPLWYNRNIVQTGRDAVFINNKVLIFRPEIEGLPSYSASYEISKKHIIITGELIKILEAKKSERKRGFSTNVVKLRKNENLIAYHAVINNKYAEYQQGFMLLNDAGIPQAESLLILKTEGALQGGRRPYTLFGCGLVKYRERIYFIGGVGDSMVAILSADITDILSEMKEYK